jgi:hypothetical protein
VFFLTDLRDLEEFEKIAEAAKSWEGKRPTKAERRQVDLLVSYRNNRSYNNPVNVP